MEYRAPTPLSFRVGPRNLVVQGRQLEESKHCRTCSYAERRDEREI